MMGGAWFVAAVALLSSPLFHHHKAVMFLGGLTLVGGLWSIGDEQRRTWREWLLVLFGLALSVMALFNRNGVSLWVWIINGAVGLVILTAALIGALAWPARDQ